MQGLGKFIIGYILGNKTARDWCINKLCQASCIIDEEFKKTPLGKMLIKTEKKDDGKSYRSEEKPVE